MIDYKEIIYGLKEKCYFCKKCLLGNDLPDELDPHVFSSGRVPAKIMIIGEAPGKDEQTMRLPFVGRSGKFLNEKILFGAGLVREEIYCCNIVKCRPEDNRTPFDTEIIACRDFLDAEIILNSPSIIITLGNIPLYGVCETTGITKKRGVIIQSRVWSNEKTYNVFPMLHPAFVLRGSGIKEMAEDIEKLKELVIKIRNGEDICPVIE